jgi:nicotinamidase-related amidase
MRHPEILQKSKTALLVVDIQEKLIPAISIYPKLEPSILRMIKVAAELGLTTLLTEQYPKGLGSTLTSIKDALSAYEPIEKNTFSCCGVDVIQQKLEEARAEAVVLVGVEAHVCVQQTALDLLAAGFRVHVPADAVASQRKFDWQIAIERMRQAEAIISTTQSIIFELLVEAGTPEFKAVLPLLKEN